MLPYSAVAAIDYAAYQSRPGLSSASNGASFTHSWLVPTQDLCGINFKPNQQQNQLIVDPGHVEHFFIFIFMILIFFVHHFLTWEKRLIPFFTPREFQPQEKWFLMFASVAWNFNFFWCFFNATLKKKYEGKMDWKLRLHFDSLEWVLM